MNIKASTEPTSHLHLSDQFVRDINILPLATVLGLGVFLCYVQVAFLLFSNVNNQLTLHYD